MPIFVGAAGTDATSPEFQATIAESLKDLKADQNVDSVIGYAETGDKRFISEDGDSAYVVVALNVTDEESVPLLDTVGTGIKPRSAGASVVSFFDIVGL